MVTTLSGEHTGGGERDRGEKEIPRSRPSRNSTEGVSEFVHGPFPADLSVSDQPLVRRWEGIARMRALGSQPPPPAPGWRAEVRTSHTPESGSPYFDGPISEDFSAHPPGYLA